MLRRALRVLGCIAAAAACACAPAGGGLPSAQRCDPGTSAAVTGGVRAELLYAVSPPDGSAVRVGGLTGALPPEVAVVIHGPEGSPVQGAADAEGRFELALAGARDGDPIEAQMSSNPAFGAQLPVRDPAAARRAAVGSPIDGAGSVPNDLIIVGCPSHPVGALVRSGDNAISPFDLERGLVDQGVRFPAVGGHPANPWFVAAVDAPALRVAVSLYGQGAVALVDLAHASIERTMVLRDQAVLDAPFTLAAPADIDGDGQLDTMVTRFVPTTPQALAVIGDGLWVGFTSFVAPRSGAQPPIYLPGVLARWSLAALDQPPKLTVLPALDPQELRATADGRLLVVCSGVIDTRAGVPGAITPGGVLLIDPSTGQLAEQYDLGDFAPGTALISGSDLWVGSLAAAKVMRLSLADPSDRQTFSLNDEAVDSVFRLLELPGGLIAAASFDTDQLHLIDPQRRMLAPPPFYGPLVLGPGRPIFDGVQVLALRPGRAGVDFSGPNLFALAGIASRVTPIDLGKLLGP